MLMLTAFIAVLARWSRQRDFLVPLVFAGRDDPDCLDLIGFFSYVLLLRMELQGTEDFAGLLVRVSREFAAPASGRTTAGWSPGCSEPAGADRMKLFHTSFNWLSMSAAKLAEPRPWLC